MASMLIYLVVLLCASGLVVSHGDHAMDEADVSVTHWYADCGTFTLFPSNETYELTGEAWMAVYEDSTTGSVAFRLLVDSEPSTFEQYHAHGHEDTCANGGGPHYKQDPTIPGVLMSNEIHFMFQTDAMGNADATTTSSWSADRDRLKSIIIHYANIEQTKIACCDLGAFVEMTASAPGAPFASFFLISLVSFYLLH